MRTYPKVFVQDDVDVHATQRHSKRRTYFLLMRWHL